jgi:hypothetical protein
MFLELDIDRDWLKASFNDSVALISPRMQSSLLYLV